jgi:hypothetical protein
MCGFLNEFHFFFLICRFSLRLIICKTPLVLTYRSKGLIRKLWRQLVQHLNWMVHIQLRFCLQFCLYSFIFSPGTSSASHYLDWLFCCTFRVICRSFWKDYQQCKEVTVEFMLNKLQGCRNLLNLYNLRYFTIIEWDSSHLVVTFDFTWGKISVRYQSCSVFNVEIGSMYW